MSPNVLAPKEIREQFQVISKEELAEMLDRLGQEVLNQHKERFLNTKGIACFSELNDDLLMWSHYGGHYKGYCLGFRTDYKPFFMLRKVHYTNNMPNINGAKALIDGEFEQILDLFCTKSNSWNCEREWRIIHQEAGALYTYEAAALDSVYFGPDIERESMEIICLILKGQNPDVKLWKGSRSNEKFRVNFEQFHYTSYADAKKQGIVT